MKKLLNYFHIVLHFSKMTIADLISMAFGIKTMGDPDITIVSHSDPEIQTQASKVQSEIGERANDPHPSLTKVEQKDVDILARMVVDVKGDVERQANAKAAGNRAIFEAIVRRVGFLPRAISKRFQRVFESKKAEKGSFHVAVPSEGKNTTYVFKYGVTTDVNVIPQKWEDPVPIPVTELIVNGFKSGTIVAVCYAAVAHPKKSKKSGIAPPVPDAISAVGKVVSSLPTNKAGKITIAYGVEFLHFSDPIYIVIQ